MIKLILNAFSLKFIQLIFADRLMVADASDMQQHRIASKSMCTSVLQIRKGFENNAEILFLL